MGAPITDLYPTMDARFVLVEIGKLSNQMEANTKVIDKLTDKVSTLSQTVGNILLIGKVLCVVIAVLAGAVWWLGTVLWPYHDKLLSVFSGR